MTDSDNNKTYDRDAVLKTMLSTAPKTHDDTQKEKRTREYFEKLMSSVPKVKRITYEEYKAQMSRSDDDND